MKRFVPAALVMFSLGSALSMEILDNQETGSVTILDDSKYVLSYRFGDQLKEGVDPKYRRSSYVHPLWSLDGQTELTDDFPDDHPHHRGIYWAWPRVEMKGVQSETWHPHEVPLRQHFVRWHEKRADDRSAKLIAENKWLLRDDEKVAKELVTIVAHPVTSGSRAIDFTIQIEAVGTTLSLQGSQQDDKGYGGFCYRAAPLFKGAKIKTEQGPAAADIVNQARKWTALDAGNHTVAIFASPEHPDYPPKWMARNSYAGFVNASWPGLSPVILEPGRPITLQYRMVIWQKSAGNRAIRQAYQAYLKYKRP